MRTEADIRERLQTVKTELAALQKQYRDLTDTETVQHLGIEDYTAVLEGAMARVRAYIRAIEWGLGKA